MTETNESSSRGMNYPKLKTEIKEIAEIAAGAPEAFREKCFEVLLTHLLASATPPRSAANEEQENDPSKNDPPPASKIPMTTQLRLFMKRTSVTKAQLSAVLMVADDDVHFVREPCGSKVVDGQMQWALLLALKNCILNNEFTVDPEDVRSICQDKGFYDGANFAANFKTKKYTKLFKGPMERQGDAQAISNEGQNELAKLIGRLSGDQE